MKENNNKPAQWHSNISQIEKNFYFHSLIKYANNTQHYIVEDIQNFMKQFGVENQVLYYLKQIFLTDKKEFLYQTKYYQELFTYSQNLSIRRKDVCKLLKYFVHKDDQKSQYEIVLIMEYGEPDRIDVDQIENSHINKFLKNIIGLLQDIKKYSDINHGNLDIQNIILVQDILKISGFKPIYIEKQVKGWKEQIALEYGRERLDLFLLGLLWLQFKKFSTNELAKETNSNEIVYQNIKNTYLDQMESLRNIEGKEILLKLLDLKNHPQFDLQQLQLLFDTTLLLKDLKNQDQEDLNPFKESLKSEYVNSSLQNDSQHKNKMIINKDFSLKADIIAKFKKNNKDELISIQDFNENEPVEIYNEEKIVKDNNLRMSVTNEEQPKKTSQQYNSEKQFESYKQKIQQIKEEVKNKNKYKDPIEENELQYIDSIQQKDSLQNNKINLEESYKESLVNFSLDQQSQQKDHKDIMSKNNSSGIFQLQSLESKHFAQQESNKKNKTSDKKEDNDKPQKRDSKNKLFSYLDNNKKRESLRNKADDFAQNDVIEEKDESKFESVKPKQEEIDFLNIDKKIEKPSVTLNETESKNSEQKNKKTPKKVKRKQSKQQNQSWQKVQAEVKQNIQSKKEMQEKEDQDPGDRFYELVQKAQNKQKEIVENVNGDQGEDEKMEHQKQEEEMAQQAKEIKANKKPNQKNSYQNMFMKNQKQKKVESKKKPAKNYTNTMSKQALQKQSYKNLHGVQTQQNQKKDKSLDTKIQKVLKKHQAKMLKNQRILKKDEKLDKSLEQVRRQKYGVDLSPSNGQNQTLEQKPNQKIKSLLKQSKVSNVNENQDFQTQTKVFESINKKLFKSTPQDKKTEMPITQKKEVQNDYKSIRPMKQKKITSIPAEQNPLVKGLPDIRQKDKLDKSSFDIKFDISLNKSRNYDSYIDCKYKSNNYRSRSKNLPTDNILQGVYQKQNTFGNETLNFSIDNSFVNTMQDPNKTIANIMDKFDDKNVNNSQLNASRVSQSKTNKKAQFDLGEVQKLLLKTMQKQPDQGEERSQKQSPNQSMNRSMNRSMNKSVNKSRNKSYVKNQETIQEKLKNDPEYLEIQFGRDYQQKMKTLGVLLKHQKLDEAIELLFFVLQSEIGQAKIDAYKQLGILFCYTNDLDKAVEYTIRGIEYQDNQNLKENYVDNKKALLMNLAITYSRRKEYDNCLDILMDDMFQNEENQPIAYMTILGDCHYAMKNFLNAFESYKEQIERLCQLLINKDIYHNFILLTKKAVASLIEGNEFQFFPDFVKFIIKCSNRFTTAQETYEGKAKFEKLQDKLVCAMIHIIWSKKSTEFMLHLMKYQKSKNLINLKHLSPKEVNILVDDILSYALSLKNSDQFKKHRDDFYLANDYILEAINSVENQEPLSRQKVITLFNQGIFLIQERNFQLAKVHHQECLDILNNKDIQNEQQIYVILYNIGLSMYKMNDEKNCIYYLEQIYQKNCNNKQILSQTLYLLILSYYKTSQYEKIVQYFDDNLTQQYEIDSDLEFEHLQMMLFLYFFANFRLRSGSLKTKLLEYQEKLQNNQDELMYHIVLANSKLMLKYYREKNLKVNIPLQEKLNNLLLKDQKNIDALMKMARDFYFQQVEQVPIGQCIAQQGVKDQANFIASFILQMINLLNFSCSREYTIEEKREVINFVTNLSKNEEFKNKIFSQSLNYKQSNESKHDLGFINQEISKLDTTQNLATSQKLNQTNKEQTKKETKPKNIKKPAQKMTHQSTEQVFNNLKTDQDFERLWLCASKEKLDTIKGNILESCQQINTHSDKKRALLKLILSNKLKQNDRQIVAGIKKLKLHKMQLKDFLEVAQALLITADNLNLRAFMLRVQREAQQYFPQIIQAVNKNFLQNYDYIMKNMKIQNFKEKQFYVENSVFYHLLTEQFKPKQAFLILTEELSILMINFFKCLKLKNFNFVRDQIDSETLEKYKIFNIIYQYFVKDKNQEQIKYIDKTFDLISKVESTQFQNKMFLLYMLINYCHTDNLSKIKVVEKFRKLLQSEDLNQQQLYMFVMVTSLVGNVYFRKKMWMVSNKLKQLSFEGFKKLDFKDLQLDDFPLYSKEYILFSIFSYWYMNEHNLGSTDLAKRCLASMDKFNFQEEDLKNQYSILILYNKKFTEAGLDNDDIIQLENDGILNEILNNVQLLLVE